MSGRGAGEPQEARLPEEAMSQPLTLPLSPATTGNPCPPGWRDVEFGERIADVHEAIGGVVGVLRRWGIEVEFPDDMTAIEDAMSGVLRLLDVEPADVKYESYVVAG
jgi:hypothetical protein